jgi:hypothetical protein
LWPMSNYRKPEKRGKTVSEAQFGISPTTLFAR